MSALFTTNDVSNRYDGLPNFVRMMQHYNGTLTPTDTIEHAPFHKSGLTYVQRELRNHLNFIIAGGFGDAGKLQLVFTAVDVIDTDQAGAARKQMQCSKVTIDDREYPPSSALEVLRPTQELIEHAWSSVRGDSHYMYAQKDEGETLATGPNRIAPTMCSVTVHRSVNVASAKRKCDEAQGRNQQPTPPPRRDLAAGEDDGQAARGAGRAEGDVLRVPRRVHRPHEGGAHELQPQRVQ
jgi:hypothetical protein